MQTTNTQMALFDAARLLILELARNDSNWGYTSIRDRLRNFGHCVSRSTVASVLKERGIDPAPTRGRLMSRAAFLKAHWAQLSGD